MNDSTEQRRPGAHLGDAALEYLLSRGSKVEYAEGETIVRRGEKGRYFCVVLDGEAEIHLESGGGKTLPLARLQSGATFGEMALLRDEPVSADVVAVCPTTILRCPADQFQTALAECEPLRNDLLARLAGDLHRTTSEAWSFFLKADALQLLMDSDGPPEEIIAESPKMRTVVKRLGELAQSDAPVLVRGEPGTGKLTAARSLHERAGAPEAPLIIVDCRRLSGTDPQRLLFGSYSGRSSDSTETGPGAFHLARGGSLVLRHVGALDPQVQERLVASIPGSKTRLIATEGPENQNGAGAINPDLLAAVADSTITMPPMGDRRRDIVPLARLFLQTADPSGELHFTQDAERTLASLDFGRRNGAQLREAVEVAVLCAEGAEIRPEHIFGGAPAEEKPPGIDLRRITGIGRALSGRAVGVLRLFVLVGFGGVIVACLGAGSTALGRAANGLIWSGWEPVIFALFLLAGSLWCTVCPLSTIGRWAQRLGTFGRPPPGWLKKHGVWLAIGGFFFIVWAERVFHMVSAPAASAVLLLTLIAASVICCVIFSREVWCRYVCPLGALASGLAPAAPLGVGARPGLCTSSCTTHNCFKGATPIPGCTVFHHPLNVGESHQCKLCLDCLKSCPHGSTGLFVRLPFTGIARLSGTSSSLAPFAVAIVALAPVFLIARGSTTLDRPLGLLIAGVVAIGFAAIVWRFLPHVLTGSPANSSQNADPAVPVRVAFSLLVLGWGPLMAYQVANIEALSDVTVIWAAGSIWSRFLPGGGFNLMVFAQCGLVVSAILASATLLAVIFASSRRNGFRQSTLGWAALGLLMTAYAGVVFSALG